MRYPIAQLRFRSEQRTLKPLMGEVSARTIRLFLLKNLAHRHAPAGDDVLDFQNIALI